MTLQEHIENLEREKQTAMQRFDKTIGFLRENAATFETIGIYPVSYCQFIDFNRPDRRQTLAIIKAFPGKWEKSASSADDGSVNYEKSFDADIRLRIWCGKPPGSCKIVEEEVVIPEHRSIRRRLVCKETEAA